MWFNGTHFVNSIYRHLFPWILLGLAQVFILPYGKSKEMTDRLQEWTQFVFFKEISFAASLGPICMYTARWREFKGSKVSCLRKQCNDKAWIHIYLNHYVSWERSGPGQPKCESCSPKRQAGIQIFFFEPCNCQETTCFMHTGCGSISFLFQILVSISLFYNN